MTLGTDDSETSCLLDLRREFDIRTTTRHVGGDRYDTCSTRLRNDLRLLLVELGVEDVMLDLTERQHAAQ